MGEAAGTLRGEVMFGKRYQLFTLFGFRVWIDASWLLLAVLIVWSLAVGVFPRKFPGQPVMSYWLMGVGGAIGLFLSIVVHELAHSLVARRFGIPMRGITLFIFGGVAEMTEEPPGPKSEFLMAGVGPLTSLALGALLVLLAAALPSSLTVGVIGYLGAINLLLGVFNLVPAFPLDGGRLLRATLWRWRRDLTWATRISAWIGGAAGLVLMAMGVAWFVLGNVVGAVWWFLIGLFLRNAARSSYRQHLTRQALEGQPIRRFMKTDVVTVPAAISVAELVESYLYRHGHTSYPVLDGERVVGQVDLAHVREVPRAEWQRTTVGAVAIPCSPDDVVAPDVEVMAALAAMSSAGKSRLLVLEEGRLVGLVALKDLLRFLAVKSALDEAPGKESAGGPTLPWTRRHLRPPHA